MKDRPEAARARAARRYREKRAIVLAEQKAYKHRVRAAAKGVSAGSFTPAQWAALCEIFDGRCAYCDALAPLEIEHMTPITRGGAHDASNIVPACKSCNSGKRDRTLCEWRGAGRWALACACERCTVSPRRTANGTLPAA
jgi:5-methylcytosine-specific restriction endonuclease McrA